MSLLAWVLCLLLPARVMAETDVVDGIWYEFSKSDNQWLLKERYRGARSMARAVFYITTFCCCAIAVPAFFGLDGFLSIYYPSMGIVATAEVFYFSLCDALRDFNSESRSLGVDTVNRTSSRRIFEYGFYIKGSCS